jgi:hypothetical protein
MKPTRSKKYVPMLAFGAAVLISMTGCQTVENFFATAQYSESAYQTAKSVKEKSLALIDKARDRADYAAFVKEDAQLMEQFDSAIASEQRRPKNRPSVEQWKTMKAEMRRFLDLWKTKGKLSPAYIDQQKPLVEKHFETLIKTEQEKRHSA